MRVMDPSEPNQPGNRNFGEHREKPDRSVATRCTSVIDPAVVCRLRPDHAPRRRLHNTADPTTNYGAKTLLDVDGANSKREIASLRKQLTFLQARSTPGDHKQQGRVSLTTLRSPVAARQ